MTDTKKETRLNWCKSDKGECFYFNKPNCPIECPKEYLLYNKRKRHIVVEKSALDTQVGGDHYKQFKIQPIEFITVNKLGFIQGDVVERICRYNKIGGRGILDLKKIKHEIDILIELNLKECMERFIK